MTIRKNPHAYTGMTALQFIRQTTATPKAKQTLIPEQQALADWQPTYVPHRNVSYRNKPDKHPCPVQTHWTPEAEARFVQSMTHSAILRAGGAI